MIIYRLEVAQVTRDRRTRWVPVAGMDRAVGAMGFEALDAERARIANRISAARFRMGLCNRKTRGERQTMLDLPRSVVAVRIVTVESA